ncbi:MAG: hypothetical protein J6C96_12545 [Oscillospiraceae bacterium]|nr:hypothetical protein [Oscillospiraceae bacterium]
MAKYDELKEKLSSLSTAETYSPTHKQDGIFIILSMAEENDCFDKFIDIIDKNPNEDFDGIGKLIFADVPELEVIDD